MRLKTLLILVSLLWCSNVYSAPSGLSIDTNLTVSFDNTVRVISGSDFTTHPDYDEDSDQVYLCAQWKDFDDNSMTSGGWSIAGGNSSEWVLTATDRTGDGYYGKREYVSSRLAAMQYNTGSDLVSTETLYAYFWCRLDETNYLGGKIFRWYWGDDSSRDNHYLVSGNSNSKLRGASEVPGTPTEWGSDSYAFTYGEWALVEYVGEYDGAGGGTITAYFNGQQAWTHDNWFDDGVWDPLGHSVDIANLCEQTIGDVHGEIDYDDVYIDYTQARVMLCNSSTYSNGTHFEIQLIKEWATDEITLEMNKGSFAGTENLYLYVIDSDGNISSGLSVSGTGGDDADTTPPNITGKSPTSNATSVAQSTSIVFHVEDSGSGVDADSLTLSNAVSVSGTDYSSSLSVTGDKTDYTCTLSNATLGNFDPGETVTVGINVKDLSENGVNENYSFTVEDNTTRVNGQTISLGGQVWTLGFIVPPLFRRRKYI